MAGYTQDDLIFLMERLRDPETGCPWDLEQDFSSIVPHTLEEVYEVVDTIERADYSHLKEELGDLLFQVVFYAQLGKEQELFDFGGVIDAIVSKLLARHPHVFPEGTLASKRQRGDAPSQQAINSTWESLKQGERQAKGNNGLLDDVPVALPALNRSAKIQKRASSVGFDWSTAEPVFEKVEEELAELREAITENKADRIEDEFGDLLFTMVNLSRHLKVNPESALRRATSKFERRFSYLERVIKEQQCDWSEMDEAALEALWQQAKQAGL